MRYGRAEIEVVVETVLDRRPYAQFDGGIDIGHRLRENVRAGVTVRRPALFVGKGEHLEGAIAVDDFVHRTQFAVDAAHQSGAGETFAYALRDFESGKPSFDFHFAAVFQCDKHKKLLRIRPYERPCIF